MGNWTIPEGHSYLEGDTAARRAAITEGTKEEVILAFGETSKPLLLAECLCCVDFNTSVQQHRQSLGLLG